MERYISTRLQSLKTQFREDLIARPKKETVTIHEIFENLDDMEIGEEVRNDIWTIIKVNKGWMVKGINFGTLFLPE